MMRGEIRSGEVNKNNYKVANTLLSFLIAFSLIVPPIPAFGQESQISYDYESVYDNYGYGSENYQNDYQYNYGTNYDYGDYKYYEDDSLVNDGGVVDAVSEDSESGVIESEDKKTYDDIYGQYDYDSYEYVPNYYDTDYEVIYGLEESQDSNQSIPEDNNNLNSVVNSFGMESTSSCLVPNSLDDLQKEPVIHGNDIISLQDIFNGKSIQKNVIENQMQYQLWYTRNDNTEITIEYIKPQAPTAALKHVIGYFLNEDLGTFKGIIRDGDVPSFEDSVFVESDGQSATFVVNSKNKSVGFGMVTSSIVEIPNSPYRYYSKNSLNSNHQDQMVAYRVSDNEFILSFEDMAFLDSDKDYNDILVRVKVSCNNNPKPNHIPVINLLGDNPLIVYEGSIFIDPGATATDVEDGNITPNVIVSGLVNTSVIGTTTLIYSVTDSDGNSVSVVREVVVKPVVIDGGGDTTCKIGVNLIKNGSFEDTIVLDSNKWTIVPWNNTALGWKSNLPDQYGLEIQAGYSEDASPWLARDGSQYTEIDWQNHEVFQDVDTLPGKEYKLSFYYSPRPHRGVEDNNINIYIGGALKEEVSADGLILTNTNWSKKEYTFTATSTKTRVSFEDKGIVNGESGYGMFIDQVSFECTSENNGGGDNGGGDGSTKNLPVITLVGANPLYVFINTVFNDPGATASDVEDGDLTSLIKVSGNVDVSTLGTTTLLYSVKDSDQNEATTTRDVVVVPVQSMPKVCSDGVDNDADGKVDSTDPGCHTDNDPDNSSSYDPNDNDETDIPNNGGGNNGGGDNGGNGGGGNTGGGNGGGSTNNNIGGGGGSLGGRRHDISNLLAGGEILGASSCFYLRDYLKIDWQNDRIEVLKLQSFLNVFEKENLSLNGVFDDNTFNAVSRFQLKYKSDILTPWGHDDSTGFVYILTKKKVNEIYCDTIFPVNNTQQQEIDAFRSFLQSIKAQNQNVDLDNLYIGNRVGISDIVLYKDIVLNQEESTTTPVVDNNAIVDEDTKNDENVLKNAAISLLAFPSNINIDSNCLEEGCLIVFVVLLAIVYLLASHISRIISVDEYTERRTSILFIIGSIIAILLGLFAPLYCIILPFVVAIVVVVVILLVKNRGGGKKGDDLSVSDQKENTETIVVPDMHQNDAKNFGFSSIGLIENNNRDLDLPGEIIIREEETE